MPDEFDTQLIEDLKAQNTPEEAQPEPQVEQQAEPEKQEQETKPEPKMFDEDYVRGLRAENAKYRRQLREEQARNQAPVRPGTSYPYQQPQQGYQPQGYQPPVYTPAAYTPQQEVYDPRVDDMLLQNKISEIKADPYLNELFNEVDDEGRTFEEKLLEKAYETQWPVAELDALAFKMERNKILGKTKQKGIDEAYNSMKNKSAAAPERVVSSGKNIEAGEINTVDDAIRAAMRESGVTSLKELR